MTMHAIKQLIPLHSGSAYAQYDGDKSGRILLVGRKYVRITSTAGPVSVSPDRVSRVWS